MSSNKMKSLNSLVSIFIAASILCFFLALFTLTPQNLIEKLVATNIVSVRFAFAFVAICLMTFFAFMVLYLLHLFKISARNEAAVPAIFLPPLSALALLMTFIYLNAGQIEITIICSGLTAIGILYCPVAAYQYAIRNNEKMGTVVIFQMIAFIIVFIPLMGILGNA